VSERTSRLVLISVMCVTLLLPYDINYSNWWGILGALAQLAASLPYRPSIHRVFDSLAAMLTYLAVPVILLVNVAVLQSSLDKRWKKRCRALLLVLCPLRWWGIWQGFSGGAGGIGLWVTPIVVTVAALLEVVFIISERKKKIEDVGSAVE
jgi:hypothetical protein